MSKTPYTRISLKEAEGISKLTSNNPHSCDAHYDETIGDNSPSIRLAMENLNRNYRNTVNPENCVDGSCDTVYIPIIIFFSEYNNDSVSALNVNYNQNSKYNSCIDGINKYNLALSGQADYDVNVNTNINSQINPFTIEDHTTGNQSAEYYKTKVTDIGYYTGAQIYNEELDTFEDEFVSHRELRELYPNIQFFFPNRVKVDHIVNNFFTESSGCKVNLIELLDYLEVPANNIARNLLNNEYLYFASDFPGLYVQDSENLDNEFYTKLNGIQKIINGNNTSLDIESKILGDIQDYNSSENEGTTWFRNMNHQGYSKLGFSYFAMGYAASSYVAQNSWSASMEIPYTNSGQRIKGGNYISSNTFAHEFEHTTGRTHAWVVPVVAGTNAVDYLVKTLSSGELHQIFKNFPGAETIYTSYPGSDTSILNKKIINFDLKPPFAYETENLLYKNIKRDSDKADEDYNYWSNLPLDRFAGNNRSLSEIIEKYAERKTLLNNRLESTSSIKIGDFIDLNEDEKGYIEYVYNKFLPEVTRNFSVNVKFLNGSLSDGGAKARVYYSDNVYATATKPSNTSASNSFAQSQLLLDIMNGVSSFWGGSYILKNPPAFGSIYQDGVVLNGSLGRKPIEQRYAYIIKVVALTATWDEAMAIEEQDGFFLPDAELLSELVDNGSAAMGGQNIGNDTDFHTNLYGDHSTIGTNTNTVRVWTSTTASSGIAKVINFSRNSSTSHSPTSTLMNSLCTAVHIKQVDLLEDNTIATQLVVNPTNDDGTRKGPDVTTRIPFCLKNRDGGTVSQTTSENIYYDPFWVHNFNAYNPDFPAYPGNTPVDNLMDPEFCPCLHTTQTYYNGDGNTYEFQIIGGEGYATAAHAMLPGNRLETLNQFKVSFDKFNNILQLDLVNQPQFSTDFRREESNRYTSNWLAYTTNRYKNGYDSPELFTINNITSVALHTYEDPEQTVLTLPYFSGYCGFGWGSVLPVVYNIDTQKNTQYKIEIYGTNSHDEEAIKAPKEFNSSSTLYMWESELRLGYPKGSAWTTGVTSTASNMESRYSLGSENSASPRYNPLAKYVSETASHNKFNTRSTHPKKVVAFDTEPKLYYHEDFYGIYNPFGFNDVMMYGEISSVSSLTNTPINWVKKINYLYNRDADILNNYKAIYEQNDPTDLGSYSETRSDFQTIIESISTYVKNFPLEDQIGGCNDSNAYNYNELATYNDGSCVERIYGCLQTWADNYKQHADGTLNTNINTDDGSCVGTVCNNTLASGNYGAGYSTGLINNILEYSEQYDTQALIEAASVLVTELDTSDNSNCQFTAIPRNTIIRLICTSRNELENLEVCNDNPIITYIRDKDTGDFYNYTSNPEVVQTPLLDLIWKRYEDTRTFENGVDKLILYNHINLKDRPWYSFFTSNDAIRTASDLPFPSDLEGERPTPNEIKVYIFGDPLLNHYNSTGQASYQFREKIKPARYNCIENPIIADGTGGCLLYTENSNANNDDLELKLGSCVVSDIQTITPYNCENQILFSPEDTGGYILDFSIFNTDEELQSLNPCASSLDTEPRYIIGGNLADNYSAIAQSNGIKVTYSQLPKYSGSQLSNLSGYSEDILDSNLIPNESRNAISFRSTSKYSVDETIATSSVLYTSISEYFYTIDGNPYSGSYVVKYNTTTNEIYYEIHSNTQRTSQSMNKLYTRVQVLELNSSLTSTYEETLSKKMHKVINKIINLPIFTDN